MRLLFPLLAAFAFLLHAPSGAEARCGGRDLREGLSAELQARLAQEAAKVPFSEGNHWIARKGNRQLHVVGTQHSGDPRMFRVMRSLRPIIRAADLVLLEVTAAQIAAYPDQPDNPKQDRFFILPKGQRLDRLMSPQDWRVLSSHLRAAGIEPDAVLQLQPWVIGDLIGPEGCLPRGIGRRFGLDDRIERQAQRASVPIAGLETTNAGLAALAAMPLRDQARLLLLDLQSRTDYDSLARTQSAAYFEERLTEGRILTSWMIYADLDVSRRQVQRLLHAMDRELLDRRNQAWMREIAQYSEDTIVIAVGAAHLPGNVGLLNLLARENWRLSRASF